MSLRHAILGFLEIEAASGYTLMQRFEGSVGAFWTATQSQIYRELHALQDSGHAKMELVPQDGKPARKLYELTPQGRAELQRWLAAPMEPMQLRDPFQLRLVFAAQLPADQLGAMLSTYEQDLRQRLAEYRERVNAEQIQALARSAREGLLWTLSIESGIAWCESQLKWLADARVRLAKSDSLARRRAGKVLRARRSKLP